MVGLYFLQGMIANWLLWLDIGFTKLTPFVIYCIPNTHHARKDITQKHSKVLTSPIYGDCSCCCSFWWSICFKFDEDSHHKILKFSLIIGWPEKTLINNSFHINFISRNKRHSFLVYWWPFASKLKSRQNMIFT